MSYLLGERCGKEDNLALGTDIVDDFHNLCSQENIHSRERENKVKEVSNKLKVFAIH